MQRAHLSNDSAFLAAQWTVESGYSKGSLYNSQHLPPANGKRSFASFSCTDDIAGHILSSMHSMRSRPSSDWLITMAPAFPFDPLTASSQRMPHTLQIP